MKVDEADLAEAKQDEAVAVLKATAGVVKLSLRRYKLVEV